MIRDIKGLTQTPTYAAIMKRFDTNLTCSWMAPLPTPSICPFLIMFIASYTLIVRRAVLKPENPSPGLTRRLMNRWSCSMMLLRYLHCRSCEVTGNTFFLLLFDGRRIGVALIDIDDRGRLMCGSLQHLAKEPFGGSRIPFGAEHEVDRLALGIDRAKEVIPFPFDFYIGLIDLIRVTG